MITRSVGARAYSGAAGTHAGEQVPGTTGARIFPRPRWPLASLRSVGRQYHGRCGHLGGARSPTRSLGHAGLHEESTGDEVAGPRHEEADDPRDVGASEDLDHRTDVEALVDEGDLGAQGDHVRDEADQPEAPVDAVRDEEGGDVVAPGLEKVEVEQVD